MNKISPETLRSRPWHSFQATGPASNPLSKLLKAEIIVPLVIFLVLVLLRAYIMAGIVAAISLLVLAVRTFSPGGRRGIDKALGTLAHWVGQIVAVVLLGIPFFLIMTGVRVMNRLTGSDPLLLRSAEAPTFWLPSDVESRRTRYVRSMFCTERLARARLSLVPIAVVGILLFVAAEVGLRIYGFGTPVLYVQDPDVGYYPKPNQRVRAPGRIITINNHSMRAADVAPQKAPGHIRILLLGDSTLAGWHVSNHELYSSLVEQKLNAAAGAPIFEVMNMGGNAWGPHHEFAFVKKFGTFEADVAVICGFIYNAYRPLYGMERLPFFPEDHPPRLALEEVFYHLAWRHRETRLGTPLWSIGEAGEQQCQTGLDAYAAMAAFLQEHGAEVMIQMLPSSRESLGIAPDEPKERLLADLRRRLTDVGITAECAGPIFKDAKSKSKIFYDGVHFDRFGHSLYADYFAERLIHNSSKIQKTLANRPAKTQSTASNSRGTNSLTH